MHVGAGCCSLDLLPTEGVASSGTAVPGSMTGPVPAAAGPTPPGVVPTAGPAPPGVGSAAANGVTPIGAQADTGLPGGFPVVAAIPTIPLAAAAPGQCAANFALGQQCGGNLTGSLYSCSMFPASCTNTIWAGGCCPAASPCTTLAAAGNWCMTCGGEIPKSLATAAENAPAEQPSMCLRMGPNNDFDYGCVLGASMKFYDAQRSGKLPASNPIPWRGDTGLLDKAPNGASLAGGW